MKRKPIVLLAALASGLLMHTSVFAADAEQYQKALEKVQAQREDAASKIQLWSTTGVLLESAENAAEAEHYEHAIELVKEAGLHIDLALATAEREKKTWQSNVPK
jgi:archaellin